MRSVWLSRNIITCVTGCICCVAGFILLGHTSMWLRDLIMSTLTGCPFTCHCITIPKEFYKHAMYIDCSRRGWTYIPKLPRLSYHVDFSDNNIKMVETTSFKDIEILKYLDLSNNAIETIDEDIVKHFTDFRKLDLSSNNLIKVPRLVSTTLSLLNLNNNLISEIKESNFEGLPNLWILHLSEMPQLRTIHHNAFCGLEDLRVLKIDINLHMNANQLRKSFEQLSSLQALCLRGDLQIDHIVNIKKLQYLFLLEVNGINVI